MNEIVNKFLLTSDKFLRQLHFRQPWFTYTACWPFKNIFKKFKNLIYIYKNELDKACFTLDVAYADSKDLPKKNVPDIILKELMKLYKT